MALKKKVVKTPFLDKMGRRIRKLVGGKHFVYKNVDGKRVKVQGNKAAKRVGGRNIANPMKVPYTIRNKNM